MSNSTRDYPISAAFFCPQSRAPPAEYLHALYSFLSQNTLGKAFLRHIASLDEVWPIFSEARDDILRLPDARQNINVLVDWAKGGSSTPIAEARSGVIALPSVFIVQLGQYFRYLEANRLSHGDFIGQLKDIGGVHGYCGGAAAALSVACAADETQLIDHAAVLLRLFVGIGCCIEAVDDWTTTESTVIACRLKYEGQGDELCSRFPEPKSISITGNARTLSELFDYAVGLGLPTHKMEITGKAHNPENAELAKDFINLYRRTPALQLPPTFKLQATVRSNRTAEKLTNEGIIEDMITMIIASQCDWNTLLTRVAEDMKVSGRPFHKMVSFGMNDCVPVTPFNRQRLKTTKFEAHVLIEPLKPSRISAAQYPTFSDDAIAITGASLRLPGANNLDELWDLISKGTDCHREIPKDRFDPHNIYRTSQSGFSKAQKYFGNFLEDIKGFDRAYFSMGVREAANIDPQQRLLLELAVEALEASGYLANHVREAGDPVGCFVGASFIEYLENTGAHPPTAYTAPGTIRAFLCGRLSYYFGWTAPAEVIDTACSASMVAINRAVKSIQAGECEMALAGGVNLITGMNNYLDLAKAGFLSPTGQCKPFDQSGDGYCRSDGAGFVVLKKLSQALVNGDPIMGVIPSIETNQGGLSGSLTVPSSTALQALYKRVLSKSGLEPAQITYVEAHGTGTQAGDPIEVESVRAVLGDPTRAHSLSLGSVKGNIGHCETGAGVAGLLKVLAMIKHGGIPPLASHKALNPKIPALETHHMEIAKQLKPWDVPLRAAFVNSYGAAGSNAAVICVEPPPVVTDGSSLIGTEPQKVTLPVIVSGATRKSLVLNARALASYLSQDGSHLSIHDVAFTVNQRRKRNRFCAEVSGTDLPSLVQSLRAVDSPSFESPGKSKPVVLVFSGQNTNAVALDRTIYDTYPVFKAYIDACDSEIVKLGFPSIMEAIFQKEPISTAVALQGSIFAMQYACARSWIDAGLKPRAIIGHSFGELTALAVSGALSLADSLKLVTCRGHLIDTKWGEERGGMLVIHADVATVERFQSRFKAQHDGAELEIACYNSPTTTVVAGPVAYMDAAEQMLATDPDFQGLRKLRIVTSNAFHSSLSDPILADLDSMADTLTWNEPSIPLEACTSEGLASIKEWSASRHTRGSVYFTKAVERIEGRLGACIWVEAGLDSAIIAMARKASSKPDSQVFQSVSTKAGATSFIDGIVNNLWRQGVPLSHLNALSATVKPNPVWLPPYQFEREQHWTEHIDRATEASQASTTSDTIQSTPTQTVQSPPKLISRLASLQYQINTQCERFQKITEGHAVLYEPLCPASLYMECVVMALQELAGDLGSRTLDFENLDFHAGLGLQTDRRVLLDLEEARPHSWTFKVQSTKAGSSRSLLHCSGRVILTESSVPTTFQRLVDGPRSRLDQDKDAEKLMSSRAYGLFSNIMTYSEFLKPISSIILRENESLATIKLPPNQPGLHESTAWKRCDAVFLDGFISSSGLLLNSSSVVQSGHVLIAVGVERAILTAAFQASLASSWQAYATFTMVGETHALCDVFACTPDGEVVAMMTGVRFNKMEISKLAKSLSSVNASSPTGGRTQPPAAPKTQAQPMASRPSPTPLQVSFATAEPAAPEPVQQSTAALARNDIGPVLKSLISNYTGLIEEDVSEDSPLVDLGLDSLSSVEFASEIGTKFGVTLDADTVGDLTLHSLCQRLSGTSNVVSQKMSETPAAAPVKELIETVPSPIVTFSSPVSNSITSVLKSLLGSYTGLQEEDMPDDVPLIDLGLDSLSSVEFASELNDKMGADIDSAVVADMTLSALEQQLGASATPPSTTGSSTPGDISTAATTPYATGASTPDYLVHGNKPSISNGVVAAKDSYQVKTVEYKRVSGVPIHADIYVPLVQRVSPMPLALMIHGGGHMTLSRKAVRPTQAKYLLSHGFLPISIDYRLCPEVNLIDGPIADVRDAYVWACQNLGTHLAEHSISVDGGRVVVVGWSTGGHLAMSLGWSLEEAGVPPPKAVLSFYAPVDFESGELDNQKNPALPKPRMTLDQITKALPRTPVTQYGASSTDETNLGWLHPGDPRSELLLHVFHSDIGLPLILHGLPISGSGRPSPSLVASISPLARLRNGSYTIPTFIIHGTKDVIAPYAAAERFVKIMSEKGVKSGFLSLSGTGHVFDVTMKPDSKGWEDKVKPGLDFLIQNA
uniref:Non-reducing polyketide synthase Preu6 n=1 Tax=Preussia isomera TaxID=325670 RepID=PREU6_PREIS|nr:RecName: Full=Non-reducing polyketide synthase Preu6; Short=NR-PKS Preu6; AltName: Full=Lecanoric acid synthase [Preussia isomera]UNY67719.1 polyketide synthase Preu6 [Preussia isomera]